MNKWLVQAGQKVWIPSGLAHILRVLMLFPAPFSQHHLCRKDGKTLFFKQFVNKSLAKVPTATPFSLLSQ